MIYIYIYIYREKSDKRESVMSTCNDYWNFFWIMEFLCRNWWIWIQYSPLEWFILFYWPMARWRWWVCGHKGRPSPGPSKTSRHCMYLCPPTAQDASSIKESLHLRFSLRLSTLSLLFLEFFFSFRSYKLPPFFLPLLLFGEIFIFELFQNIKNAFMILME